MATVIGMTGMGVGEISDPLFVRIRDLARAAMPPAVPPNGGYATNRPAGWAERKPGDAGAADACAHEIWRAYEDALDAPRHDPRLSALMAERRDANMARARAIAGRSSYAAVSPEVLAMSVMSDVAEIRAALH